MVSTNRSCAVCWESRRRRRPHNPRCTPIFLFTSEKVTLSSRSATSQHLVTVLLQVAAAGGSLRTTVAEGATITMLEKATRLYPNPRLNQSCHPTMRAAAAEDSLLLHVETPLSCNTRYCNITLKLEESPRDRCHPRQGARSLHLPLRRLRMGPCSLPPSM